MRNRSHFLAGPLLGLALLWQTSAIADQFFGCCSGTPICCVELDMSGCVNCVATPGISNSLSSIPLAAATEKVEIEILGRMKPKTPEIWRPPTERPSGWFP